MADPDGSDFVHDVEIGDVPALLADTFSIELSDTDSALLVDWMRARL